MLVLCYHAISTRWGADLSVTPVAFERQLERLIDDGYQGAPFTEAVLSPPSGKTLVVTFDDAYRSVLDIAVPILERLGLPGTVFVPTAFAGAAEPMHWSGIEQWLGGPDEPELRPLCWDELRGLADLGWEIGSHTRTHPHLTRVDDARLRAELTDSRAACERHMGRPCRSIAYPYGDVDDRVVEAADKAGYVAGAGLPAVWHAPSPLNWPRVGVYHEDGLRRFGLKVSPRVRRLRLMLAA